MKFPLLSLLLLTVYQGLWTSSPALCQDSELLHNTVVKTNIHTVQLHPEGWKLAYPVIELGGKNRLKLSFDDFSDQIQDYSYRLIHCNADWTESQLSEFDYLEGFTENPVRDYELSFNTNIEYVHYQVTIPNEDIQPKLSGNYIIQVFQDFDTENIVLSQRFMMVEPKVKISGKVKYPINLDIRESHQEVDFTILHDNFTIDNPLLDLTVVLTKNNRWDSSMRQLKPLFIRPDQLVYDYDKENVFAGGNEYRHFDLKSLRYQTRYIKQVTRNNSQYHVELFAGENRHFRQYIYDPDLNGKSYIEVQERDNNDTEADYAWVKFTLPWKTPIVDGKFYVFGQLSKWQCNSSNAMKYNYQNRAYELELLLKQGYYNYQFAFVADGQSEPDMTIAEGSHKQTENDYVIYVYFHDLAKNYDRLIGWEVINSIKQIH